ncbi:MAG: DEAD/DEAH box helicase, partial [Planctomycetota bacterium]
MSDHETFDHDLPPEMDGNLDNSTETPSETFAEEEHTSVAEIEAEEDSAEEELMEEEDEDDDELDVSDHPFTHLGLEAELVEAALEAGFEAPNAMQTEAIPAILEGRDMVLAVPIGGGRTATWLLPLLNEINEDERGLILVPNELRGAEIRAAVDFFSEDAP